jgi:sugar lactone lactonase YvrE
VKQLIRALVVTALLALLSASTASATVTNTFTGTVDTSGTKFVSFKFAVAQPGTLTVTLDWDNASANLNEFLYDPSGAQVASAATTTKKPEVISYQATTTGTWKVGVKAASGSANFTVTVDQGPPQMSAPTYAMDFGQPVTANISPVDQVTDSSGNWWVIDEGRACVREYAPDLTTVLKTVFTCGSVGGGNTMISRARGMGIDPNNNDIWIADTSGTPQRVLKIDPSGNVLVSTTVPSAPGGALSSPGDVVVDNAGNAYIIDQKDRIVEVNANGSFVRQFGSTGTGTGQMRNAMSIAFSTVGSACNSIANGGGCLYVTDARNFRVDKWTTTGTWLGSFGSQGTGNGRMSKDARGIAVDSSGTVYVADVGGNRIIRFTLNSNDTYTAITSLGNGLPYYRNGQHDVFYGARGLTIDGNNLAVSDTWGDRMLIWNKDTGAYVGQIGGGDTPCSTDLQSPGLAPPCDGHNEPRGIAIDAQGNTYVSDYWHQWIEKFSPTGTLLAHWGLGRGSDLGSLNLSSGLAVDNANGLLYIANRENRDVDVWKTSDGTPVARFPMPAGPAFANGWPRDVAVNQTTGDVYAADEMNNQWVIFGGAMSSDPGQVKKIVTTYGPSNSKLGTIRSIAVGSDGTVYVADGTNKMIDEYTSTGTWIRSFGTTDGVNGVEVSDVSGQTIVYVLTWRVREYAPDGTQLLVWGTKGTANNQFVSPFVGIDVNPVNGDIVVADTGNHRVKVFAPSS